MKTAHIICSIKNLNYDYEHLQWLRLFFLSNNYRLLEDWINHSLTLRGSKPYFKPAPNFDYMRIATNSINDSDVIVFLMSERSTFTLTMLRYALYRSKPSIVLCNSPEIIGAIDEDKNQYLSVYSFKDYQKRLRDSL